MKRITELADCWELTEIAPKDRLTSSEQEALEQEEGRTWYPLTLPAQVHDVLLKNGVIADPAELGKCEECLWVSERDWIYRRVFSCDRNSSRVFLRFKGLDTLADIYLNGELIAQHNDMYLPQRVEITPYLQEKNLLLLHFHSPQEYLKKHPLPEKWEGLIRPYRVIRKCDNDFIDYLGAIPYLTRIGIYDKVLLECMDKAELVENDVRVLVNEDLSAGSVRIKASGHRSGAASVSVALSLTGPNGEPAGQTECAVLENGEEWQALGTLEVSKPQLWWPRGYGEHPLYTLTVTVFADGKTEDTDVRRIGFRRLEMPREFDFYINGRQIKLWGAQPAPVNGMTHCWDNEKSNRILDLVENCNMNAQRVWGGSDRYDDAYYEEADKRGILIWQEFFHDYSMYPDDPAFRALCKAEAAFQVMRLKHHPCLLFWCGGNEAFMGAEFILPGVPYIGGEIFLEDYQEVCSTLDPDRYYHPNSPWGGPFTNDPLHGDTHSYTNTWYVPGADYPVMVAEEIRTSPPPARSMRRYLGDLAWPQNYTGLMTKEAKYPWPESWNLRSSTQSWLKIPPIEQYYDADSLESAVYRFGAAHGRYLRGILENNRRGKPSAQPEGERICKGHFVCRWNDCWPIIYGSMLDYYLEPYIPYYETKRAYEPVLISFDIRDFIYVWVVNDSPDPVSGTLRVKLFDPDRNEFAGEISQSVEVASGESKMITDLNAFHQFSRQYVLFAELEDGEGRIISRTDDFTDIERHLRFPEAKLSLTVSGDVLTVRSDRFAHCVELTGNEDGDEFGWVFEDNYFDLLPCETKRVRIMGKHGSGTITAKAYYSPYQAEVTWQHEDL